jgi:hypothetical protein
VPGPGPALVVGLHGPWAAAAPALIVAR